MDGVVFTFHQNVLCSWVFELKGGEMNYEIIHQFCSQVLVFKSRLVRLYVRNSFVTLNQNISGIKIHIGKVEGAKIRVKVCRFGYLACYYLPIY